MKRTELYKIVKHMIELTTYITSLGDVKITDNHVKNIVRFIEKEYHKELFGHGKSL